MYLPLTPTIPVIQKEKKKGDEKLFSLQPTRIEMSTQSVSDPVTL